MTTIEPEELVRRIGSGDKEAETALYKTYWDGVVLVMEMKTHDLHLAEDLAQDACLVVLDRLRDKGINEPAKLKAFLHSTAKLLLANWLRKKAHRVTTVNTEQVERSCDERTTALAQLLFDEGQHAVRELIDRIGNLGYQELLYRRYVLDEDKTVICRKLDMKSREYDRKVSRARAAFRKLVERAGSVKTTDLLPHA